MAASVNTIVVCHNDAHEKILKNELKTYIASQIIAKTSPFSNAMGECDLEKMKPRRLIEHQKRKNYESGGR